MRYIEKKLFVFCFLTLSLNFLGLKSSSDALQKINSTELCIEITRQFAAEFNEAKISAYYKTINFNDAETSKIRDEDKFFKKLESLIESFKTKAEHTEHPDKVLHHIKSFEKNIRKLIDKTYAATPIFPNR